MKSSFERMPKSELRRTESKRAEVPEEAPDFSQLSFEQKSKFLRAAREGNELNQIAARQMPGAPRDVPLMKEARNIWARGLTLGERAFWNDYLDNYDDLPSMREGILMRLQKIKSEIPTFTITLSQRMARDGVAYEQDILKRELAVLEAEILKTEAAAAHKPEVGETKQEPEEGDVPPEPPTPIRSETHPSSPEERTALVRTALTETALETTPEEEDSESAPPVTEEETKIEEPGARPLTRAEIATAKREKKQEEREKRRAEKESARQTTREAARVAAEEAAREREKKTDPTTMRKEVTKEPTEQVTPAPENKVPEEPAQKKKETEISFETKLAETKTYADLVKVLDDFADKKIEIGGLSMKKIRHLVAGVFSLRISLRAIPHASDLEKNVRRVFHHEVFVMHKHPFIKLENGSEVIQLGVNSLGEKIYLNREHGRAPLELPAFIGRVDASTVLNPDQQKKLVRAILDSDMAVFNKQSVDLAITPE